MNLLVRLQLQRRKHYRACFMDGNRNLTKAGEQVLADLRRFCKATHTSAVVAQNGTLDPIAMAINEGRREVWNRIQAYLNLTDHQIFLLTEDKPDEE